MAGLIEIIKMTSIKEFVIRRWLFRWKQLWPRVVSFFVWSSKMWLNWDRLRQLNYIQMSWFMRLPYAVTQSSVPLPLLLAALFILFETCVFCFRNGGRMHSVRVTPTISMSFNYAHHCLSHSFFWPRVPFMQPMSTQHRLIDFPLYSLHFGRNWSIDIPNISLKPEPVCRRRLLLFPFTSLSLSLSNHCAYMLNDVCLNRFPCLLSFHLPSTPSLHWQIITHIVSVNLTFVKFVVWPTFFHSQLANPILAFAGLPSSRHVRLAPFSFFCRIAFSA